MAATSPSLSLQQLTTIVQQGKYNLIPIYQTLHTDLETPVSAYIKVCNHSQSKEESKISASYSFLLESVEGGERQARYSYIGTGMSTSISLLILLCDVVRAATTIAAALFMCCC